MTIRELAQQLEISIHAPRVGSDFADWRLHKHLCRFQSTLPAWGATRWRFHGRRLREISIHAPRVGSDYIVYGSPCAGKFQSTLPAWGATTDESPSFNPWAISIHAPRVGSDCKSLSRTLPCPRISIHAPRVGSDTCVPFL